MIAYTLQSLRDAIDEWLENDSWGTVDQKDSIISISEEKIYKTVGISGFNTKQVTLTVLANQNEPTTSLTAISASQSPLTPISCRVVDGSGQSHYLLLKDKNFGIEYSNTGSARPKFYAFYNDPDNSYNPILSVYPKADVNYTDSLFFEYFFKPESLTEMATSGTTWLSTFGQEALLYSCITNAYIFMKGDADLISLYDMKFKEALQALVFEQGGNFRNPAYDPSDVAGRSMVAQ